MQQNNTQALGREPVGRLLRKLAMPAIAAQIINLLYNLVDRMYIGHIHEVGKLALTGVGVCLPLIMLISAFAALAGMGAAPRASIFLGQGNQEEAEKTLGNAVTLLFLLSVILTAVFILFARPMLLSFGASENTIDYAMQYMRIYAAGTIFVQMTLGLNAFITCQGFSKISMLTVLIGAVCNIILDPILIFGFHMGVRGAALATILSQALSMIWILRFLTGKKTTLRIKKANLRLKKKIVLPSVALGMAPFIMQSTESLIAVCFNASLLRYGGDLAVGAMTILTSVNQFAMLPLMGLTQGAQPIISYNYGAKDEKRVKQSFKLLLLCCVIYSTVLWASAMLFPGVFVKIFNNDPALVRFASHAMRIYLAACGVFGVQIACQQTFIALGNAKSSLFLALLRKIILLIPLIYLMPVLMPANKTTAVFAAEPVADLLAVATTATLFFFQFRAAMRRMETETSEMK
ncbi:MATE family efflux transporter [Acidaminobacterium chupaoyuni]